jgi:hypothetical protein
MPLLKDKFSMLFRKLLRARKFTHLQSKRLAQFYAVFDVEDGFAAAVSNVDMHWPVFVAVKEESISVLLEDFRHDYILQQTVDLAPFFSELA